VTLKPRFDSRDDDFNLSRSLGGVGETRGPWIGDATSRLGDLCAAIAALLAARGRGKFALANVTHNAPLCTRA